jgi:hypothetical protein
MESRDCLCLESSSSHDLRRREESVKAESGSLLFHFKNEEERKEGSMLIDLQR